MDLSCCRELLVLADRLNFGDAAEQLYLTQSALSKHVAAAERETGFRIFDRSTAKVELTESGRVFIEGLHDVVDAYDRALRVGRSCQRDLEGVVRIIGPLSNVRMLNLVVGVRGLMIASGSAVRVQISDTGVRDCYDALVDGRADIAIAFRYGRHERQLHFERLFYLPFGIACHEGHPLVHKKPLLFADIAGWPLVTYPLEGRAGYHRFVERICRKHGIGTPESRPEEGAIVFPETDDQVVFGVHFPGYANIGTDMVARPLDEDGDMFEVCAVRRKKEPRPEVRAFFNQVVEAGRIG